MTSIYRDELAHKWLKKGEAAEVHKYIERWWKNGRWFYKYPDDNSVSDKQKLTGKTDHYYATKEANDSGAKWISGVKTKTTYDGVTGAGVTTNNITNERYYQRNVNQNSNYNALATKATETKTRNGGTNAKITYSQNGRDYVTSIKMDASNNVLSIKTKDVTIDTKVVSYVNDVLEKIKDKLNGK